MTNPDSCAWCQRSPAKVGHALQKCGRCKMLYYCQKVCQEADWKHHKEECRIISQTGTIPPNAFMRALITSLKPALVDEVNASSVDTITYLKTSITKLQDISISGPFYPLDAIVEQIKGRLTEEVCFTGLANFEKDLGTSGIASLQEIKVALPEGLHMTIEVCRMKNPEVAAFLRRSPPNAPRPVYTVCAHIPDPTLPDLSPQHWGGSFMPLFDAEVLGTFLEKKAANECGREVVKKWKESEPGRKGVYTIGQDGMMAGRLIVPDGRTYQIVSVRMDDGRKKYSDGRTGC
ncbi:hypothetical protein BU26DRAFT_575369 [Trematosphaeria pertusa]|uniref:MYND-type domain-containing protein n=1 Tax=Trematosphaeria pertusa TaxID=390896 RepID=A0A6A6J523_9PLEO|nr:uncharacterized protein BU26DRAFT_575369 [Trematosphaeria pertusa]KAF2256980.1 hypothetical protein BU26DRAFT_575369 [Trematosphaeria pertusa]